MGKHTSRNIKVLLLANILLLLYTLLLYFGAIVFDFNISIFLKYYVIVLFVLSILQLRFFFPWNHSIMFFFGAVFLFTLSRVLLDLIGFRDLNYSDKYVFYLISDDTISKVLFLIILTLISVLIGVLSSCRQNYSKLKTAIKVSNDSFGMTVFILLMLTVPGTIIKSLHDLMMIKSYGFMVLYKELPPAPLLLRISWFLFSILFPIYLSSRPEKKRFIGVLIFFFIVSLFDIAKGSRGVLFRPIIFSIWFFYKFYSQRNLKISFIVFFIVFTSFISDFMLSMRESKTDKGTKELLVSLLNSQGVTFVTMANYFDYNDKIRNPTNFYILSPITGFIGRIIDPVYREGHSVELVERTFSLDHKLMYAIRPNAYLQGTGFGSSFILELFALGGLVTLILGSFFLGRLVILFERLAYRSNAALIFSYFWIQNLVWMPRGSFIPNIVSFMLAFFLYQILSQKYVFSINSKKLSLGYNTP